MDAGAIYYAENLKSVVDLKKHEIILDYGAGTGVISEHILKYVRGINIYDSSAYMTSILKKKFLNVDSVRVLEVLDDMDVEADLVLICSVIQYIDKKDLATLVQKIQKISKKNHKVVITDIIPLGSNRVIESILMLKKAKQLKILPQFLWQIISTIPLLFMSSSQKKLTKYNEKDLINLFNSYGYSVERLKENLGLSNQRYSVICSYKTN